MIKLVNILESITEKQVTKGDWDKADGEQRVDWLLQIFDDADKAEKHFETEWEDLPNEARDFMKISESVNEGSPGYSKFIFSLQTLIGDIAPNAWEDKSQIDSTSMKRIHNSLKKRYGDDYAKFNDLLKTQKGQFGNWYLKESVNEGKWMDLWDESQDKAPSAWTKHQKWIVANAERYGFDPTKVKKLLKQHTAIHNRTYGMFASVEDWMEEKLKSRRTS